MEVAAGAACRYLSGPDRRSPAPNPVSAFRPARAHRRSESHWTPDRGGATGPFSAPLHRVRERRRRSNVSRPHRPAPGSPASPVRRQAILFRALLPIPRRAGTASGNMSAADLRAPAAMLRFPIPLLLRERGHAEYNRKPYDLFHAHPSSWVSIVGPDCPSVRIQLTPGNRLRCDFSSPPRHPASAAGAKCCTA